MEHLGPVLGHIVIFLTTMAGFVFQWLREGRRHRWQQEQMDGLKREIRNGKTHE